MDYYYTQAHNNFHLQANSCIFTRNIISSIFIYKNDYIYIANQTLNAIQLYHTSGLPLNIFTKQFGNVMLKDKNAIDKPIKIIIDNNDFLYICNYNNNITLFDLNYDLSQIGFADKDLSNDYLDPSSLHLNPIDICVKENERIIVLYTQPYKCGIYNYEGEKINFITFQEHQIPQSLFYEDSHIYIVYNDNASIQKYDKNGVTTNFIGTEYGNESLHTIIPKNKILYTQYLASKNEILLIDINHNLYIYDLKGYLVVDKFHINILDRNCVSSYYYDDLNSILYVYHQKYIYKIKIDFKTQTFEKINFAISYAPQSQYVPTTNMEALQFLASKKELYKKILKGYKDSNQYLNENKEYKFVYYDYYTHSNIIIPSYELIFILQQKFLYTLTDYLNDPFIQKYPQHFMKTNYPYYQSKRQLYIRILQTYKEGLLYEDLCKKLEKVLVYDDYLNLTDNIKLIFDINIPLLFPRIPQDELKKSYNKNQTIILNKSLFL